MQISIRPKISESYLCFCQNLILDLKTYFGHLCSSISLSVKSLLQISKSECSGDTSGQIYVELKGKTNFLISCQMFFYGLKVFLLDLSYDFQLLFSLLYNKGDRIIQVLDWERQQ